jgi:hypothetical protein
MKPVFWKLSMGPGTAGEDFKHILEVLDWIRQGLVLVHKDTKAKGTSQTTQGQHFVGKAEIGDYFYLCHGNEQPSVILLGQFYRPCEPAFSPRRWLGRPPFSLAGDIHEPKAIHGGSEVVGTEPQQHVCCHSR